MADRVSSLLRTVLHPVLSTLRLGAGCERLPVPSHHAVPAVHLSGVILTRAESASPLAAEAMYGGVYDFAGSSVTALPDSVFTATSASAAWKAELRRMDWLASFRASARPLHGLFALRLLAAWMQSPALRQGRADQIATLYNLAIDAPAIAATQSPAAVALAVAAILKAQHPVSKLKPASASEAFARATALLAAHLATRRHDNQRARLVNELTTALDALLEGDGSLRGGTVDLLVRVMSDLSPVIDALEQSGEAVHPQLSLLRDRMNTYLSILTRADGTIAFADSEGLKAPIALPALRGSALAADAGHARLAGLQTLALLSLPGPGKSMPFSLELIDAGRPLLWVEQTKGAAATDEARCALMCAAGGSLAEVRADTGGRPNQHLAVFLSGDGTDLRVEDMSAGHGTTAYLLHVPEQTKVSTTHGGMAAMIVPPSGHAWQLLVRAGKIEMENGGFKVHGDNAGGQPLNFALKRVARAERQVRTAKGRGQESVGPRLL